jgi:hypothetical protein
MQNAGYVKTDFLKMQKLGVQVYITGKVYRVPRICIEAKILLCVWVCVTIDGVCIGECIYWSLKHTARKDKHLQRYRWFPHYKSLEHTLSFLSMLSLVVSW